ncbi:right-handed parallel beta-helix repeat-containing protein [Polymorphobacter arshaanensis]|uniref:right-handed parallel beta-helix repeat-containing protein n=1 Tax=Glacieibacterium arshaanense TaxID=2511025 RepID=UPI00140D4999|nr:right-handed parallel beta-helix repeat-containing protein [Polymorphobacter arshaanensis]
MRFRGGVAYRGTILMPADGSTSAPIRYVGDEWGAAPAIFDGSDAVTSVERCPDAARCGNAPNWAQLSLISFKPPATALVKFFDDTGILYQGQYPAPPDPFFSDDIDSYAKFPVSAGAKVRGGELEWPDAAKRLAGNAEGTELSIWVQANQVTRRTLVGARGNVLVFIPGDVNPYTDRDGRYAIVGSPMLLDAAGQYASISPGKAVAWLRGGAAPTIGNGRFAIDLAGRSNIVIRGFAFEHFAGGNGAVREGVGVLNNGGASQGISIVNNKFRNSSLFNGQGVITLRNVNGLKITGNEIREIERGSGVRLGAAQDVTIENNRIERVGRTGIALLGVANSTIRGNRLAQITGVHGNAITLYLNNRGALVEANTVTKSTRPMTFHGDKSAPGPGDHNFVITHNVFVADADGIAALISWGANTRGVTITGNILIGPKGGIRLTPSDTGITIANNISSGLTVTGAQPGDWKVGGDRDVNARQMEATLAKAGPLPADVCASLKAAPGTAIGADWRCP